MAQWHVSTHHVNELVPAQTRHHLLLRACTKSSPMASAMSVIKATGAFECQH